RPRSRPLVRTLLRTLVRLFPKSFRSRFGNEVVEHALLDWEHDKKQGVAARAWSIASTVVDLGRSALAERLQPSWREAPAPKKGPSMTLDLNGWVGAARHALRTLRRAPGFAATVVGTLGLAIGTITAVFAVLDHVLLSPLPYAHPERLVFIA